MTVYQNIPLADLNHILWDYVSCWRTLGLAGVILNEGDHFIPATVWVWASDHSRQQTAIYGSPELPDGLNIFKIAVWPNAGIPIIDDIINGRSIQLGGMTISFQHFQLGRGVFLGSDDYNYLYPKELHPYVSSWPKLFLEGRFQNIKWLEEQYHNLEQQLGSPKYKYHTLADASQHLVGFRSGVAHSMGALYAVLRIPLKVKAKVTGQTLEYTLDLPKTLKSLSPLDLRAVARSDKGVRDVDLELPTPKERKNLLIFSSSIAVDLGDQIEEVVLIINDMRVDSSGFLLAEKVAVEAEGDKVLEPLSSYTNLTNLKVSERRILLSIIEMAILQQKSSLSVDLEGLRLRALIRESDKGHIEEYLSSLIDNGFLTKGIVSEGSAYIELFPEVKLPSLETDEQELVENNAIRRALLFKLFEESARKGHRHAQFTLINLAKPLQVKTEDDIRRNTFYLQDNGYLEYPYADGGACTSYLTVEGWKTAEIAEALLSEFPTIEIQAVGEEKTEALLKSMEGDPRKVFVVHGRNEKAREAMFTFLRAIGLDPIEWSEAIKLTGKASPYIGEILDAAFAHARAIVVLLTGDDLARLGTRFTEKGKPNEQLTPQPRPNVIFESGLAFGRNPDRTILVELGALRPISNLAGRHTLRMDGSGDKRQQLADRLRSAGCAVQTEYKTDWLKVGDFDSAVVNPDEEVR